MTNENIKKFLKGISVLTIIIIISLILNKNIYNTFVLTYILCVNVILILTGLTNIIINNNEK